MLSKKFESCIVMLRIIIIFFFNGTATFAVFSQTSSDISPYIQSDSLDFSEAKNNIKIGNESFLYFISNEQQPIIKVSLKIPNGQNTAGMSISSSNDYLVMDSLKAFSSDLYVGRIRLNDIITTPKPTLKIKAGANNFKYNLLPIAIPVLNTNLNSIDAFLGEEKTIEIPVANGFNIKADNTFVLGKDFDYNISYFINFLIISIKPHSIGTKHLNIPIRSIIPIIDSKGNLTNELQTLSFDVNVKPFKLSYINFDRNTIFYNQDNKNSQQVLADYNSLFEQNKTYRIEDQQNSGATLIAELYVESIVDNSKKVICRLKPFTLHKISDGYLYIKDSEKNRFICNFNVIEKPKIEKVELRKNGDDWDESLKVHPGEQVEVKIQGKGLLNNKIQFDGIADAKLDSSKSSDEAAFFRLKIPLSISHKHISIFLDKKETQYQLSVKEFLKPDPLDFVSLNYGQKNIELTNDKLNKPVFYDNIIKDVNIVFDPNKIDVNDKTYGKQYINIEVRLLNKDNDLIEIEKIENVVVCPGDKSPRSGHYDQSDCNQQDINLNDYLDHKTFHLPAFTQIIITISHDESKYDDTKGNKKKIRLVLVRKINLDLQLSFPTGLLVKDFGESGIGSLSGISASVLFNITPYEKKESGKLSPYSIGAGFLALNALNLSSTSTSDLGVVIMGTIQPFRKNAKFSVPIFYLGYGYFVKSGKFFTILGPGLQFNF